MIIYKAKQYVLKKILVLPAILLILKIYNCGDIYLNSNSPYLNDLSKLKILYRKNSIYLRLFEKRNKI